MSLEKKLSRSADLEIGPASDQKIGYFYTLVHVIKGVIGVGLFAMGYAVKNGGLYVGPPLVFAMGCIAVHCQHQLVNCAENVMEYDKSDEPLGYATAVELCFKNGPEKVAIFAKASRLWINICICITQFGFCCVYLVFIAENIQQVFEANGIKVNLRILILIVWFPIWLFCLITNLKALAPVSISANILIIGSFIATITVALMGELKNLKDLKPYTTPWEYAIFLGTTIFSFETIALVLPIKNAMKRPETMSPFFGVLNIGMAIVIVMYLLSGITGYLRWGDEVAGSLTLNLGNTITAQCIKAAVSAGIIFTYPLHFYVPIQVLLPNFLTCAHLNSKPLFGELLFRTLMTICTVIIAEIVPKVGLFVTLIGALCSTSLALVFPPLTELVLLQKSERSVFIKILMILKNVFILCLALVAFTISTTISVIEIVQSYFK